MLGENARNIEPYKSKWKEIKALLSEDINKCQICGLSESEGAIFECHEEWSFNSKTSIQKLESIIILCQMCHKVKHIGRTIITNKENKEEILKAKRHLAQVNNWSKNTIEIYISDYSLAQVNNLNKIEISILDMTYLDEFMVQNNLI